MSAKRALYSIVQYVPDPGRAEAANAGVVLYVPETKQLELRLSPTLKRVKTFFKLDEPEFLRLKSAAKALDSRLAIARSEFGGESDFARFIAARADALRLTAPRVTLVADVTAEVTELYAELVGDSEPIASKPKKLLLPSRLEEVFAKLRRERRAWIPKPLLVPLAMKKFTVHAAYENGVRNYVRAEPIDGEHLAKLAFYGQMIRKNPIDGRDGRLVVVSTTERPDPALEARFGTALRECATEFIPFDRVSEFAAEVERDAH